MSLLPSRILGHTVLLSLFLVVCTASPSYYIAMPSNAILGAKTSIAIHWFGGSDITVSATITNGFKPLTKASEVFQNDSIKLLTLPEFPADSTSNYFELVVNGSSQNNLVFSNKIQLPMQMPNTSLFLQTDKDIYKPGEVVNIRMITTTYDLKPYTGLANIEIRDPKGNIVQQQLNMKSDLGVISTQFLLVNSPVLGDWSIKAKSNGVENVVSFLVTENDFEKFDVTLDTSAFYFDSSMENLTGTVTAKYFSGLPVKGNAIITVEPIFDDGYSKINKTYKISGSANFSFTPTEIQNFWMWGALNITASVTEEFTGIMIHTSFFVRGGTIEYQIRISNPRPTFFPGQNFTAQLQVQRVDNKPLTNEERKKIFPVTINLATGPHFLEWDFSSREFIEGTTEPVVTIRRNYTIPATGIVNLEFPVQQLFQWIEIQAQYQNAMEAFNFDRPSTMNAYIEIQIAETLLKVGTPFEVQVNTYPKAEVLYYVVIAKGMAVAAGKSKTTFSLTPEQSWAPYAQLTVYLISINSNFADITQISHTLHIKVALKNKVTLKWSKNSAAPSENISISVSVTESQSLVGLRVVEKGSSVLEARNDLTLSKINETMWNSYQSHLTSQSDAVIYNAYEGSFYSIYGTVVPELVLPMQSKPSPTDTWIWLETNISSSLSRSLQVTVPDKNATWVATAFVFSEGLGLGVTDEPIELSVIKSIFILLNIPTSLTRGEQFILEVMLRNNLKEDLQVTVTLKSSNSFDIIVPNNNTSTTAGQRIVTVPKQNGATVLFPINPKVLGNITITVNAQSNVTSDTLTRYIIVRPEGVRNYFSQTQIFELHGSVDAPQTISNNFSFNFPSDVVRGSEEAFISVFGDLLAPSMKGLESLITMPYGCGEQNMVAFAPNIYIILYLTVTNQIKEDIRLKANTFMQQGYQRELQYQRLEGSFSAFGNSDNFGSTWLTAFVFRCFLQARTFIYIDLNVLSQAAAWLVQYQDMSTGIFSEPGNVIHKELQGGLNGPITLTAYIVTSLLEDDYYKHRYESNINKAVQYLENKFEEGISSNYTLSIVAYALTLAKSVKAQSALNQLNSKATIIPDKGTKYWSAPSETADYTYWQPRTTDIETASYALLSFYKQTRIEDSMPVMKWLIQQRNHLGGYSSTQDTVMALQALSLFDSAVGTESTSFTMTATGPGSFVPITFQHDSNRLALQRKQIEISQPLSITATARGRGLAIFQFNVIYNTKASSGRSRSTVPEAFGLNIIIKEDESNIYKLAADVCMSYLRNDNETGMVMLEFGLLNGFELSSEGIPKTEIVKEVEPEMSQVNIYISKLTKDKVCISIPMVRSANVVGSQDAVVKLYEYYNPRNSATRTYNSVTMKRTSYCNFCGLNCTQCGENVQAKPQPNNACAPVTFMLWLSMFPLYYLL